MPIFRHVATFEGAARATDEGNIIDLALHPQESGHWLYAASRDGALSIWSMDGADPAALIGRVGPPGSANRQNLTTLEVLNGATGPHVITGGVFGHDLSALAINTQTGAIGADRSTLAQDMGGHITTTLRFGGQDYLYAADRGSDEISRYRVDGASELAGRGRIETDGPVAALATAQIGARAFLLAADASDRGLTSHLIRNDGRTDHVDTLSNEAAGLGFRTPSALEVTEVAGIHYVILAAAGSSSLNVMRLGSTGWLAPTDRIFDTLETRFQTVSALDVITRGEDVFVLAAGADDGISLLTLLPGGSLHHLASIADSTTMALSNVQTLAGFATPDGLTILSGSENERGITQLEVDLTAYGGARRSAPDQTSLQGGATDDILIAGGGDVRLTGEPGADTFIFNPATADDNGRLGRIMDFDPREDRIDLSMVLATQELERVRFQDGDRQASLIFDDYRVEIYATPGQRLDSEAFALDRLKMTDRPTLDPETHPAVLNAPPEPPPPPPPPPPPEPPQEPPPPPSPPPNPGPYPDPEPRPDPPVVLNGTSGNDILRGQDRDEFIFGRAGRDRIEANGGQDMIDAGDGHDFADGGNGDDTLRGGEGNDELRGGAGDDALAGGLGSDFMIGNSGDDVLTGSGLSDLVFGGPGDDFVNGGWGFDRINGGPGADRFFHLGIWDHGSDWVQDYRAADRDVLFFGIGTATPHDFRIDLRDTPNAGRPGVEEVFVTYTPTGQVMWALIDGSAQDALYLQIGGQDDIFDLFG